MKLLPLLAFLWCGAACLAAPLVSPETSVPAFLVAADGVRDATEALRTALARAGEAGGGEVFLPAGRYCVTGSLKIPSGVTLRGETKAGTWLLAPEGVAFDVLSVEGARDVAIRDLSMREEGEAAKRSKGAALAINGGSRFVLVENVNVEGFVAGFSIGRAEKGESSNIVFRGCRAEKTRTFGFDLNGCREVLLESCYAYRNWLDGMKLCKQTRDVTIRGGESSYNGTSREKNPASNGNGVDAYAGGEAFLIDGLVAEHNQGSGLYMKTGKLNEQGSGVVGNAMIVNVRCRYNLGSGLDINRSGGDLSDAPLLANVTVQGGIFQENTDSGIYVRGRNVAIVAPIIRSNQTHGIDLASAYDVDISGAMIFGNGSGLPEGGYGIQVGVDPVKGSAARIRMRGGVISGLDDITLADGDAVSSKRPLHRRAVLIASTARDVSIMNANLSHWSEEGGPVEVQGGPPVSGPETTPSCFNAHYNGVTRN